MKSLSCVIALLWSFAGFLTAEEEGRSVKFRLLGYEHSKDVIKGSVAGGGGAKLDVEFFTGGFGPQVEGRFTDGKARFFVESPDPEGKPVRKIVAEGSLGTSEAQVFVLFPEADAADGPVYKILTFDDLEVSFPMGATRVINLAPVPVRLNLAGADLPPLKPGGVQVYPQVKKVDEWNMFTARIDFEAKAGKWVPVATQSWKASERKRDWVITRVDPASKAPSVQLYQDIPPWREDALPVGGGR
jgi:hypothetical protein